MKNVLSGNGQLIECGWGRCHPNGSNLVEEHFNAASDEAFMHCARDVRLEREQVVVAKSFHGIWNVVLDSIKSSCSRAGRILEDEVVLERKAPHQRARRFKVFVALCWKPDDEVTSKREIGEHLERAIGEVEVFADGVAAVHQSQDAIGSTLRRRVQVATNAR